MLKLWARNVRRGNVIHLEGVQQPQICQQLACPFSCSLGLFFRPSPLPPSSRFFLSPPPNLSLSARKTNKSPSSSNNHETRHITPQILEGNSLSPRRCIFRPSERSRGFFVVFKVRRVLSVLNILNVVSLK